MYCSTCGSLMNAELNYCKNCGAKLAKEKDEETPKSMLDNILTALCFIAIFGFGFLIGLIAILLDKTIAEKTIIMVAFFYLAALFGICYMLLSQVPKLIDANLKEKKLKNSEIVQPTQLSGKTTAQLEEHREPVMSVTENTTRTFDKVPVKEN